MSLKKEFRIFVLASIFGGLFCLIEGIILLILNNSFFVAISVALTGGIFSGAVFYKISIADKFKISLLGLLIFSLYFLFFIFALIKITSGEVTFTCAVFVLNFSLLIYTLI
ncbi:MAG: hypothetical protein J7L42_06150 [Elusimicrobia bacterium]|nr:hypothetical protein [Elusimicrobiota bacterium]